MSIRTGWSGTRKRMAVLKQKRCIWNTTIRSMELIRSYRIQIWGQDSGYLAQSAHNGVCLRVVNDSPWDRIAEIGFITSLSYLDSPSNTMRALYIRNGEQALTGIDSIPYMFYHGNELAVEPDAVWPTVATNNSKTLARLGQDVWHVLPAYVDDGTGWVDAYYRGEATIRYHGTNSSDHYISWIQGSGCNADRV